MADQHDDSQTNSDGTCKVCNQQTYRDYHRFVKTTPGCFWTLPIILLRFGQTLMFMALLATASFGPLTFIGLGDTGAVFNKWFMIRTIELITVLFVEWYYGIKYKRGD